MARTVISQTGRGFGKKKAMEEEIRRMKEMAKESLIRRYENGYEAHVIDKHPHGKIYRTWGNPSSLLAHPDENIMLLNSQWIVVMFIGTIEDLNRIECEMNLRQI